MPAGRIHGFSLVETLVATTLMATTLVGLAHLLAMATTANRTARSATVAVILALEQLEILYSEPVGDGQDFFDARGRGLGSGVTPPPSTAFVRRWSAVPLAPDPDHLLLLQVLVTPVVGRVAEENGGRMQRAGTVRLVSVKRRRVG